MDDQRTDQAAGVSIWDHPFSYYFLAAALLYVAFEHGIHAWQGHSTKHAIEAALCIVAATYFLRLRTKKSPSSNT